MSGSRDAWHHEITASARGLNPYGTAMLTADEERVQAIRSVMLSAEPIVCELICPACQGPIIGTGWTGDEARDTAKQRMRRHLRAHEAGEGTPVSSTESATR